MNINNIKNRFINRLTRKGINYGNTVSSYIKSFLNDMSGGEGETFSHMLLKAYTLSKLHNDNMIPSDVIDKGIAKIDMVNNTIDELTRTLDELMKLINYAKSKIEMLPIMLKPNDIKKISLEPVLKECIQPTITHIEEPQEFKNLYDKINKMVEESVKKGAISEDIVKYIIKLEEYASYLENFLKVNTKAALYNKPKD